MTVLVWVTETTWEACVDAARSLAPPGTDFALLAVIDTGAAEAAHGAFGAMMGRGGDDPARRLSEVAEAAAGDLLNAARDRLGQPAQLIRRQGRVKDEVVAAAEDAAMLVAARDGHGPGPKSLGKDGRFVVDHAPCPVLLVWPGPPPGPPPPGPPPGPPPPPPGRPSGPHPDRPPPRP
jgi:nucleotide-binding universal stress UspA family protein